MNQEFQLRRAFGSQVEYAQLNQHSKELLLNTLNPGLIDRFNADKTLLYDRYDCVTIALVEISFAERVPVENTLITLHDMFCVSYYFPTLSYLTTRH